MVSRGGAGGSTCSGGGFFLGLGLGLGFALFTFFFGFFLAFLGKISHLQVDSNRCLEKIDKFWVSLTSTALHGQHSIGLRV